MQIISLLTPGLETIARQEVQELLNVKATISPGVIEFSAKSKEDILKYLHHAQAPRRILASLGNYKTSINFKDLKFPWQDFFTPELSFKVEVEGLSGQENRFTLAKKTAGKLFDVLKPLEPEVNLKKPDILVIIFYNGKEYCVGIDLAGRELNTRDYRLFLHTTSIKGDLAYYFVRKSGFASGEKLLIGFCKDGTIAIEAALFANSLLIHRNPLSCSQFPGFKTMDYTSTASPPGPITIFAFDQHHSNITASKKNARLARSNKSIEFYQLMLEEISLHYAEHKFNRAIFYLTTLEEDKLNEIFYQVKPLLQSGGTLLLIGREQFQPSAPKEYILKEHSLIEKGGKRYALTLLEKKP